MPWDINTAEDVALIDARYRPLWQRWYDELRDDEREALARYKSLAGHFHFVPMRDGAAASEVGAALVAAADRALLRARVPHDLVAWRGIVLWDDEGELGQLRVGDDYLHPGYTSTSLRESFAVAQTFAGSDLEGAMPVVFEFWLPGGSPGAYMEPLRDTPTREAELLLPRDVTYRVRGVSRTTKMTACDARHAVPEPARLRPILRIELTPA